jgi:hypothetical protein
LGATLPGRAPAHRAVADRAGDLRDEGIEITWRDVGWATLVGEMLPGTIGAELAEVEQMQEALA